MSSNMLMFTLVQQPQALTFADTLPGRNEQPICNTLVSRNWLGFRLGGASAGVGAGIVKFASL